MEAQLKPEALEKFALITELFLALKDPGRTSRFHGVGNDFPPTRNRLSATARRPDRAGGKRAVPPARSNIWSTICMPSTAA
jgi:curved DNA-binding protein CbpA